MSAKTAKRATPFQTVHLLENGLKIAHRDEHGQVTAVLCNFCEYSGREEVDDTSRKRRRTENTQQFQPPYRAENYRRYHLGQHPTE